MNLQELEKVVNDILNKAVFEQKLADYTYLIDKLYVKPVVTNEEYKRTYRSFFEFKRGISKEKKEKYFSYLDEVKSYKTINIEHARKIYEHVCLITGRQEVSFASKLIHVVDNDYPIWDKLVAKNHFCFNSDGWQGYEKYKKEFDKYMAQDNSVKLIIDLFDKRFPDNHISDVKKVDFVLWQDRESQISIPDEFCGHRRRK